MKEIYFTPENIQEKAKNMLFDVEKYVKIRKHNFNFRQTALIILDMQDFFLKNDSHAFIPSSPAIIPQIQKLIENFKNKKRPIIFTKHLNTAQNVGMMDVWWKDILKEENSKSGITKDLNTEDAIIIEKNQYDAFYNTELENVLRQNNVEQVIITGVMTHLCCETTARSAFVRGFIPFFAIDATATYNETFHRASLLNLSHGFAIPALTEEFLCKM
ncbi:MAG: isochorismatase family protein [Candidatus Gastranaerophilaceae bacterium]|jgi:isochorismate hydrolase